MSEALAVKKVEIKNAKLARLGEIQEGVGDLVLRLGVVVKDQQTYDDGLAALKDKKKITEDLETAEDQIINAAFVKLVKETRKAIQAPLDLGEKDLKSRMGKYQADQAAKRQREIDRLELEKQKAGEKIETADTAKDQQKAVEKVAKIEAKQEVVAAYKPKTADKVRKFEIINPDAVERKYCDPVEKKIRPFIGEVNGPIPVIPGVRIWDEFKIVTR